MKSFNQFISERRSDDIEKLRQQLQNPKFLSDAEMRAQNPQATAAYEKEAARQKIKTPEKGVTIEVGGKGKSAEGLVPVRTREGKTIYVSPEEAFSRAEQEISIKKSQKYNKPVKPESTSNIPLNRQPAPKPDAGAPLTVSTPKPAAPKPKPTPAAPTATPTATQTGRRLSRGARASVITPRALEAALTKNRQQTALAQQAQNTKAAVQNAKTLKNVAKVGTGIGAYLDFQRASQEVRNQGGGDRRATARGALEAGARIVGSGAGFLAGTPLGPVGQIAGAVGGGEVAVKKTGQAFERIFGKPGDPVTRQSVASNIKSLYREKVPQKIRSQVSPQAKQTFSGFLNKAADFANKAYKGYAKVKNTFDFSPKDN